MAVADDRGYPQPMVGSYSGDALLWHGGLSDDRRDLDLASEPRRPLGPPGKAEDPLAADGKQFVVPAGAEPSYLPAGEVRELDGDQARHYLLVEIPIRSDEG